MTYARRVAAAGARVAHPRTQRRGYNQGAFDRMDKSISGGGYGPGTAPADWAKQGRTTGPKMMDAEVQALLSNEGRSREMKDYKLDMSARTFEDEKHAGVPLFKMRLVKKSQADIDKENRGGSLDIADLSEAQRESIRRRREKRVASERFFINARAFLKAGNLGRGNLGLFNKGDSNIGFFNYGDNNKGFGNVGDYNHGVLCYGNDNGGLLILGSGNLGGLIWGDQSRGFEIWGNKQRGICKTSDSMMRLRIRVATVLLAVLALCIPGWYYAARRKQREKWLKAMDMDVSDAAVDALMNRSITGR